MKSPLPRSLKFGDENRHPTPAGAEDRLSGDALRVSVVDLATNIFGVDRFHPTNRGYGRFEALYSLDGTGVAEHGVYPAWPKWLV